MTERRHALYWLPPFLVGLAAATIAEIAVGLLLYAGPGLMQSLTTVLSVEAAALGAGLATAPRPGPGLVEALRRRWLLLLVTFLAATAFTAGWTLVEDVGNDALTQGFGLALVAALPLYAAGTVLGGLAAGEAMGAVAALGAAVGFTATGASLLQVLTPASLLLACLILLSAAALIHGVVLDARVRVIEVALLDSPFGPVAMEDRFLLSREAGIRVLTEGPYVRAWWDLVGNDPGGWEGAALRLHAALGGQSPGRVLLVGGGASTLPYHIGDVAPKAHLEILERNGPLAQLAWRYRTPGDDRVPTSDPPTATGVGGETRVGDLSDLLRAATGSFDCVLVDAAGLQAGGGLEGMPRDTLSRILDLVGSGGALAWIDAPSSVLLPPAWSLAWYERRRDGVGALLPEVEGENAEELLVATRGRDITWPDGADGFVRREARGVKSR